MMIFSYLCAPVQNWQSNRSIRCIDLEDIAAFLRSIKTELKKDSIWKNLFQSLRNLMCSTEHCGCLSKYMWHILGGGVGLMFLLLFCVFVFLWIVIVGLFCFFLFRKHFFFPKTYPMKWKTFIMIIHTFLNIVLGVWWPQKKRRILHVPLLTFI